MTVRLRIEIEAGWADFRLVVDGREATVTASYLSDGIGDLAASVASVLGGAPDSEATFAEEPGEYRWALERVGPDRLRVRISATRSLAAEPARGDVVILDGDCRLRTFAGQFASELERLRGLLGSEGYEERWGHRFPAEQLAAIRRSLADGAGRPSRPDV